MKRTHVTLAAALSVLAVLIIAVKPAVSQIQVTPAFVRLQVTTPGIPQNGHSNITGTAIAGQFKGDGSQVTGVNANLLDGIDSTAFLQSVPVPLNLSGSNSFGGILTVTNATGPAIQAFSTGSGGVAAVFASNPDTLGMGVWGSSAGQVGVLGTSSSTSGNGVNGTAEAATGFTTGVSGYSYSPDGKGIYGNATSLSGQTTGVYGESSSSGGVGVHGIAYANTGFANGGNFESYSTSGRGVFAQALATNGLTYGGRFGSASTSGIGVSGVASATSGVTYAVHGLNNSATSNAVGVFGAVTATSGVIFGGRFECASTDGIGVFGWAQNAAGLTTGVYGRSDSTSIGARGLEGLSTSATNQCYGLVGESMSLAGRGVYGLASNVNGIGYGVAGHANSPLGYAVYAQGDLGASGVKSFRIDYPSDPTNKYLLHYSTESPMPQNFYVGNVTTGANGYAWVDLPSYFSEINVNFKYQLTVVDDNDSSGFVVAKISKKVVGNRFQVRTSAPNTEVSWRVDADRNDLYTRRKQPTDVVDKQGQERGTYQHPELYGKPASMGLNFEAQSRQPSTANVSGRP